MTTLQERLRDPKRIKIAALATAILAISIGVGVSLGGRGKSAVSSSSESALGSYASGKVGEIIEPSSEATNYARYYGNGYTDYASSTTTTIRGSSGINNEGDWDDDGWSSGGGVKSSTTTSKCDKVTSSAGSEASSSAKAEKAGRARRLGGGSLWESSAWSSSGGVTSSSTTSVGKAEKTAGTTSSAMGKSEKSVEVSGEIDLYEDEDCGTTTAVVVSSSGVSSKSSKTKSSKAKQNSSAKTTSTTVSNENAWERSPTTASNVWGSTVTIESTTSPAPSAASTSSVTQLESLPPTLEPTTAAPTPCTGRVWYYNEENEKCTNDGGNDGEDEYENMLACCENEVGMNVLCSYEDVCISIASSPTPNPSTAKPIGTEQTPTTAVPSTTPEVITSAPITPEPTSAAPTSDAPTVPEIVTESPTTAAPITSEPTSAAPTSDAPTVPEIVTESPTTSAPITSEPTSAAPTSDAPTVPEIFTVEPTTAAPITSEPTSAAPTSGTPTVPEIITAEPTIAPTSAEPTTPKPFHTKPKPTVKPTPNTPEIMSAEPTMVEVTTVETVAPTPCDACEGGRKWYFNGEKCTNNGKYENDDVVFENMQTCCKESFGANVNCPYEDVCNKGSPTKSPSELDLTPTPTSKPVETTLTSEPSPFPTPCAGRKWYIVNISQESYLCTNGYDIPASAADDFTFFDSLAECCDDMFGEGAECEYVDVCSNETVETLKPSSMELTTPPTKKTTTAEPTTFEVFTMEPSSPELVTQVPTKKMTTAEPTTAEVFTMEPSSLEVVTQVPTKKMTTAAPTTAEIINTLLPSSLEIVTLAPTPGEQNTVEPTPSPPSTSMSSTPTTCSERVWYLYGGFCTNMIQSTSNDVGSSNYTTLVECCENEMPGKKCDFKDECFSPAPSPGSSELENMAPTAQPSFGSTPVSLMK